MGLSGVREEAHDWRDWRTLFRVGGLHVLLSETVRAARSTWPRLRKHGLRGIETHCLPAREVGDAEGPLGSS